MRRASAVSDASPLRSKKRGYGMNCERTGYDPDDDDDDYGYGDTDDADDDPDDDDDFDE